MNDSSPEKRCVLCGARSLRTLLERANVPVLLNRLHDTAADAKAVRTGRLEIVRCKACSFVFNVAFDPDAITYDASYENDQAGSARFRTHMRDVAIKILDSARSSSAPTIVEIGCGQGGFLELVASMAKPETLAYGFDPALRRASPADRLSLRPSFFDRAASEAIVWPPDLVISRHVIEHIPDPVHFLSGIRDLIPDDWRGSLFLETPSVDWIFEHRAVQDFFYEHCNYFSKETLATCLSAAGFDVDEFAPVLQSQYMLARASAGVRRVAKAARSIGDTGEADPPVELWQQDFQRVWESKLQRYGEHGEVFGWGAGAKGVTFAQLVDPRGSRISGFVDINPGKQGRFLPVTGHPVYNIEAIAGRAIGAIVVMNPEYLAEISTLVREHGISTTITSL